MQLSKLNSTTDSYNLNNNVNFKSRFVKNEALKKAFNEELFYLTEAPNKRNFIRAIKSIINDGRNDVIKLTEKDSRTEVLVNGKRFGRDRAYINWNKNSTGSQWAIIDFAESERGFNRFAEDESLTQKETSIVLNKIADLLKSKPEDLLKNLKFVYEKAKLDLDTLTSKEFKDLKKQVFARNKS